MIVIVEGIDRCGKTTLIDAICKEDKSFIRFKDYNVCSKKYKDENFKDFSLGKLDSSIAMLEQLSKQGFNIIVDRLHLTELVYGSIERNETARKEIGELDNVLSKLDTLLILVEPTNLAWSNEQAEKDQTKHYIEFKSAYQNSAIEKYHTDFNHINEAKNYIIYRKNKINIKTYHELRGFLDFMGLNVRNTSELINNTTEYRNITTSEILNTFNLDLSLTMNFEYDVINKIENKHGPYDMTKYHDIFDKLDEAFETIKNDTAETRRCILQFDKEHCFQYIQFIIRNNQLTVICNMRSCNIDDNYKSDIYICSLLADRFKNLYIFETQKSLKQTHNIIMNVGSLHSFKKEDNNDVI